MALTFVLVHGAWYGGWCWSKVASILRARGHTVLTPTQTGLGERSHLLRADIGLQTHITDVVNVMKWEGLRDVVLCGHSYGGMIISGVAEAMAPAIRSIVFLDAFVPRNGESSQDLTSAAVREGVQAALQRGDITMPARSAEAFGVNALSFLGSVITLWRVRQVPRPGVRPGHGGRGRHGCPGGARPHPGRRRPGGRRPEPGQRAPHLPAHSRRGAGATTGIGGGTVGTVDRRIFGVENEYGVTCTLRGQRRLSPDEVARYLFRRVVSWGR